MSAYLRKLFHCEYCHRKVSHIVEDNIITCEECNLVTDTLEATDE